MSWDIIKTRLSIG